MQRPNSRRIVRNQRALPLRLEEFEARVTPAQMGPLDVPTGWTAFGRQAPAKSDGISYLNVTSASYFDANELSLTAQLATAPKENSGFAPLILNLPTPTGSVARFSVVEVSIMEPGLAEKFPDIHTYRGQGIDDPTALMAADISPKGFNAFVAAQKAWSIEPYYHLQTDVYASYFHENVQIPEGHGGGCTCAMCQSADFEEEIIKDPTKLDPKGGSVTDTVNGANFRTFRLAVAGTGEYTAFHGGTQAQGQAAIVTVINSVDLIYERDLSARMILVAGNDSIVYTSAASDPYTGNNLSTMLGENQSNIDSVIGNGNYDIGHVFTRISGSVETGVATLNSLGNNGTKARGASQSGNPGGTNAWLWVVSHEMGHQYGARHTFNSPVPGSNRDGSAAYEVGGGSTIMSYAGSAYSGSDSYVSVPDLFFHSNSLELMVSRMNAIPGVGTTTATGNALPSVNAGIDYNIPANTFFELTATASDADATQTLTYSWEQYDLGLAATSLGTADPGSGPLVRVYPPTTSNVRTIRNLGNLLNNTVSNTEVMPTTTRSLNFRALVRDNRLNGGAIRDDQMKINVTNTGSSFSVTSPNTAVSWPAGSSQTVTWNVAGTSVAPFLASQVKILLSTDGGNTFPTTILASTANDGSEVITVPDIGTTQARIKVQPTNNIFFDISNANFSITNPIPVVLSVNRTTPAGPSTNASTVEFTATFSEPVTGVDANDFDINKLGGVTSDAKGVVTGGGSVYTITVNNIVGNGTLGLDILNNGTIRDSSNQPISGNFTGQVYTIDQKAPTVGFTSNKSLLTDANVGPAAIKFTATFNENMDTAVDPTFSFPVEDPSTSLTFASGNWIDSKNYEGTFDLADANVDLANIDVMISGGQDVAGNLNTPATMIDLFSIDTLNPTVTGLTRVDANPTSAVTVHYSLVLSEAAPGLTTANFTLATTGISGASIVAVTGGPTAYDIEVNTGSGNGTLRLDLDNSTGAADANNNPISGLPSQGETYDVMHSATAPKISTVVIQAGETQRSRVTSVEVVFDSVVVFGGATEASFQLVRQSDNKTVDLTAVPVDGSATTVTLSFNGALSEFGSLEDGRYTLTVLATSVSGPGGDLDGDGNGTGGDDYVLACDPAGGPGDPFVPPTNVYRLFGDSDGSGFIDLGDFGQFRVAFGTLDSYFSYDGTGPIDLADFGQFRTRFGVEI